MTHGAGGFAFAYLDERDGLDDVYYTDEGMVDGLQLSTGSLATATPRSVSIAAVEDSNWVVWDDFSQGIRSAHYAQVQGGAVKAGGRIDTGNASKSKTPDLVWNGSQLYAIWEDDRFGADVLMMRQIGP